MPKEETILIPLKYTDVTRSSYTKLDVLQEMRINDYWNSDENRSLLDSWKRFTKFTLLKEKPPKGYVWSGGRLTKNQATTRNDNVWPKVLTKIGKTTQKREKQEWANEKPKLVDAQRLRGIYFSDLQDEGHKNIIENATRKLEVLMHAAMPCKKVTKGPTRFQETEAKSDASNTAPKKKACLYRESSCVYETTLGIISTKKKNTKIIPQARHTTRCHIAIWHTRLFLCRGR